MAIDVYVLVEFNETEEIRIANANCAQLVYDGFANVFILF